MVGAALYEIFSGVTHLYPLRAAQGESLPLTTYQVTNVSSVRQINGTNKLFKYDVQLNVIAATYDAADTLAHTLISTADRYSNAAIQNENIKDIRHAGGPTDLYQEDAEVFGKAIDFEIWLKHN